MLKFRLQQEYQRTFHWLGREMIQLSLKMNMASIHMAKL